MERFAKELENGGFMPIETSSLDLSEKPIKMEGGFQLPVLLIEGRYLSKDSEGPSWRRLKGSLALYADSLSPSTYISLYSKYIDIVKKLLEDPKSDCYLILYYPSRVSMNDILLTIAANGEQAVYVPYIFAIVTYQDRKRLFQRILEGEIRITAREEAKPYHYELIKNAFPSEEEYKKFTNRGKELGKTVNGNLTPQLVFTDDGVVAIYVTPILPGEDWKSINEFFNPYQKKD
jgi:hypothetical protein